MNYTDLQEIIKHLKRVVPCNRCKKRFSSEELQVISTYNNEGLFHLKCTGCSNQLIVHAAIVNKNEPENMPVQTHQIEHHINTNEVLDMHNFLNQFNGDFKELFTL